MTMFCIRDDVRVYLYYRRVILAGGIKRVEVEGMLGGQEVTVGGEEDLYRGKIAAGIFAGQTKGGDKFSLMRVERKSPTLGAKAPEGAIVLFDGEKSDELSDVKVGGHKMLFAGAKTKRALTDFKLHAEFMVPFMSSGKWESG